MFFTSLNKFVAAITIRECTLWMYQMEHGLNERPVILPGEDLYREHSKKQLNREGIVQGYLSLFWGDYKVGVVRGRDDRVPRTSSSCRRASRRTDCCRQVGAGENAEAQPATRERAAVCSATTWRIRRTAPTSL